MVSGKTRKLFLMEIYPVSPAMSAIHYGQSIFEGLKAFKNASGEISIFRPTANADTFK
jgi:branched-chain amino acid aminotransferase